MTMVPGGSTTDRGLRVACLFARVALGAAFVSAVCDRLGLWGPPGAAGVAWGNFDHFLESTARLNPWMPAILVPALGVLATAAEALLGVSLIAGVRLREVSLASGTLLLLFALAMTFTGGPKAPLDYSVFTAAAAAFLLAVAAGRRPARGTPIRPRTTHPAA